MFLLPIYIESRSGHEKRLAKQASRRVEQLEKESGVTTPEGLKLKILDDEQAKGGFHWEPTRAVGWIKIDRAVGGFSFRVVISTVGRGRNSRKEFVPLPHELQPNQSKHIHFDSNANTAAVLERFDEIFLEIIGSHKVFRDGYVDSLAIRDNAKFINWKAMLETPFAHVTD